MSKVIVIKIGTSLVTDSNDSIDKQFIRSVSSQIRDLVEKGFEVTVVSSGAIAHGMKSWGIKEKPKEIDRLQALSAVGQIGLINAYQDEFRIHGLLAAQVLISHGDFKDENRSKNIKTSLKNIFSLGAIPIINDKKKIFISIMLPLLLKGNEKVSIERSNLLMFFKKGNFNRLKIFKLLFLFRSFESQTLKLPPCVDNSSTSNKFKPLYSTIFMKVFKLK